MKKLLSLLLLLALPAHAYTYAGSSGENVQSNPFITALGGTAAGKALFQAVDAAAQRASVGLGNVDNTSDANKPVSTAQQTALDLKAPIASPTFTGTVGGVSKSMVGLGNVDNTSDANKPVSTAQQIALDLKAPIASPAFTGTAVLPSTTSIGSTTAAEIGYLHGVTSSIGPGMLAHQRDLKQVRSRVVATRSLIRNTTSDGGGNMPTQTATTSFTVRMTSDAYDIKVGISNLPSAPAVTVKGSMIVGTDIYPLFFKGARTTVLSPNGLMETDELGVFLAKGTLAEIRIFVDAGTGNLPKANMGNFSNGWGGYWNTSDYTDTASPPAKDGNVSYIFGPSYVAGKSSDPCVIMIGDSIMELGGNYYGWARQAFGNSLDNGSDAADTGKNQNHMWLAVGGDTPNGWQINNWKKTNTFKYGDVAIVLLGANYVSHNDPSATIASLQILYNALAARGIRVWGVTMSPNSTSTDGFATTINQTARYTTAINGVNAWIRSLPSPLVGYMEFADYTMTARDSGIWKAGTTTDGLHPITTIATHKAIAAAIMPADVLTRERP